MMLPSRHYESEITRFIRELKAQRPELDRRGARLVLPGPRLAPADLPEIEGFEVATVYEPGTGAMAGDFFDLYPTSGATGQQFREAVLHVKDYRGAVGTISFAPNGDGLHSVDVARYTGTQLEYLRTVREQP